MSFMNDDIAFHGDTNLSTTTQRRGDAQEDKAVGYNHHDDNVNIDDDYNNYSNDSLTRKITIPKQQSAST